MPLPQPEDFADRVRALEQAVRDLRSSITNQAAVTEASQGWVFTDMSTPPTPTSGKTRIYSQDGRLHARSTAGDVPLEPVEFPIAAWQADPTAPTAGSAPATYTQSHINQIIADNATLRNVVIALLDKLIAAELMLPG